MKICVMVPSSEYLNQAGVRIRYRRLQPHLAALGHTLTLDPIDGFNTVRDFSADCYLFSKCYDVRSIVLARMLHASGKLVGADFFDDMFSQERDTRFSQHRAWLAEIVPSLTFALSSTSRMREVIRRIAWDLPVHIVNDPFETFEPDVLSHRLDVKRDNALANGRIPVAWFGVGDNPHFDVGLIDLLDFAETLHALENDGLTVDLDILTNRRALTAEGLERLSRLPVSYHIAEWTGEAEASLLERALVSFIPVSHQTFSTVKSLNRAVSALTGGTQLLSAGYPLYEPLGDFIYRDPADLLADLRAGTMRLSSVSMSALGDRLAEYGDPFVEAKRLCTFIAQFRPPWISEQPSIAIIHGLQSPIAVHKQVQRLGHMSVGSPFAREGLNYDVRISGSPGGTVEVAFSDRACEQLVGPAKALIVKDDFEGSSALLRLAATPTTVDRIASTEQRKVSEIASVYRETITDVQAIIGAAFPGFSALVSEANPALATTFKPRAVASPVSLVDTRSVERVVLIANASVPSLEISFVRPLAALVAKGLIRVLVVTDAAIEGLIKRSPRSRLCWNWAQDRLAAFDPTLMVFCRYSGPIAATYLEFAEKNGVPMVFHLDDDLLNLPETIGATKIAYHTDPARMNALQMLMRRADLVYASTRNLYEKLLQLGDIQQVTYGHIYCSAIVRRHHERKSVTKFGYMGGADHAHDLETVVPAIVEVLKQRPDLKFEVFGGIPMPEPLLQFGDRVSVIPPIADYTTFLKRFSEIDWDIGICPLAPSSFNACKANTKWVEYTAVGVAVIASLGMAYDECCADGAGLLAETHDDWVEALLNLTANGNACHAQIVRAQAKLSRDYSPAALQDQLAGILSMAIRRPLIAPVPALIA